MPTYAVTPTKDCAMLQLSPNTNQNGGNLRTGILVVNQAQRSVLSFNIAAIPPYISIDAARLIINCIGSGSIFSIEASVLRLTRPTWSETTMTWNDYITSTPWTTPGGDYDGLPVQWFQPKTNQVITIVGYENPSYTSIRSLVLDAIALRASQLHVLLKQYDETLLIKTWVYTDREADSFYPRLEIDYTSPAPERPIGRKKPKRNRGTITAAARAGRPAAAARPGPAARPHSPGRSRCALRPTPGGAARSGYASHHSLAPRSIHGR